MLNKFKLVAFYKRFIVFLCISFMVSSLFAGCICKNKDQFETQTVTVKGTDKFGNIHIDLKKIDLEYGDSVDLSFSGGYSIESVPFYPDFYGSRGTTILTDYYDNLSVASVSCNFNDTAKIQEGETLTIALDERGKYKKEFEAYNVDSDFVKWKGQSDEAFRNAREITAGNIAKGVLYRSASPFNEKMGRIELMDSYIRENNIHCILNLSDSDEIRSKQEALPEHTAKILADGKVIFCPIDVAYTNRESMEKIAAGLTEMSKMEGPYLIHCSFGRDRTGMISALLEALCGAGYDEIVADYMESYRNLHDINMDSNSLQYKLFKQRIDEELEDTMHISRDKLAESDLQTAAEDYLVRCGMNADRIEQLRKILTTPIGD